MNLGLRALLIIVILATPLAAWWFAFVPENKYIDALSKDLKHKEEMLEKLRQETSRNADLQKANEELHRSVTLIEQRLPSNKEIDAIVRQVSDLAVAAGMQPPAIKSDKPVQSALYMEQPLEMEVNGNFLGFFKFIADVEKLPRITRIHDLKITSQTGKDVELKAEFTLSIYFQDDRAMASAEKKP
ncbi:MAG: type 4a pilus biogenesis protein PilO [Phycisphaerales bacterium]